LDILANPISERGIFKK
jgi:hypothetical protein